jgi:ubiquinone/menaquinone biosynthesis C-methylase UbiE
MLRKFSRAIKPYLPTSITRWLKQIYHHKILPMRYLSGSKNDLLTGREYGISVFPPPNLRHRVHGDPDLGSFLRGGSQTLEFLQQGLQHAGIKVENLESVLDFGCGCGRTLLWFQKLPKSPLLIGTDIDSEAIDWIKKNLKINASVNAPMPPLDYAEQSIDLLYCISVFTHLDEVFQNTWFLEFQRIVRSGGILMISCHSEMSNSRLPTQDQKAIERDGFLFYRDGVMNNIFPEFYQNTYHSKNYINKHWGSFFEILGEVPMGAQDLVIMRRH